MKSGSPWSTSFVSAVLPAKRLEVNFSPLCFPIFHTQRLNFQTLNAKSVWHHRHDKNSRLRGKTHLIQKPSAWRGVNNKISICSLNPFSLKIGQWHACLKYPIGCPEAGLAVSGWKQSFKNRKIYLLWEGQILSALTGRNFTARFMSPRLPTTPRKTHILFFFRFRKRCSV